MTDLLTSYATHVISKHDTNKPLFLLLSQIAPHAGERSDPYQAPEETVEKFSHIKDINKRKYAGNVSTWYLKDSHSKFFGVF